MCGHWILRPQRILGSLEDESKHIRNWAITSKTCRLLSSDLVGFTGEMET